MDPENTRPCPHCSKQILQSANICKYCTELVKPIKIKVETDVKQGAFLGAVACLIIGVGLMQLTLFSFVFYAPLFFAAFILSIVAMAQRRVVGGIIMLLLTVIVPLIIVVTKTSEVVDDIMADEKVQATTQRHEQTTIPKNETVSETPKTRKPIEPITETVPTKQLPQYEFSASGRLGKSQVRVIVQPGTMTKEEFMDAAVQICDDIDASFTGYLVVFYSNPSVLNGWDGTGAIQETDWPYWLCRVGVDVDSNGNNYASTFKLAVDGETGLERTDVLKK